MAAGYFAKNGINATLVNMHDDTTAVQGLIAGAYDMLYAGAPPGLIAMCRGADMKIVSSFTPRSDFLFVAQKGIGSLKAMEGQSLGVSKVGSLSYLAAMFALQRESVDIAKVKVVAAGNDPDRARMLSTGGLAGCVLNGINAVQALSSNTNLHVLADVGAAFKDSLMSTAVYARGDFIRDAPKSVGAAVTALIQSSRKLQSDKAAAIAQAVSSGLPKTAVTATYDRLYAAPDPYYGVNGGLQQNVVEASLRLLHDNHQIDAVPAYAAIADPRFVAAAMKQLGPYKPS